MADATISALTAASAALGADELPINEAGTSKKLTVTQLQSFVFTAGAYAAGSFTVADGHFVAMVKQLVLTTTQRLTMNGSARLRID